MTAKMFGTAGRQAVMMRACAVRAGFFPGIARWTKVLNWLAGRGVWIEGDDGAR